MPDMNATIGRNMNGAPSKIEDQIQWLVDRESIADLITNYATCVDGRDWHGWAHCFADEGVFEMEGVSVPRSDMADWLKTQLRFYAGTQHIMTNLRIEISHDNATTRHYLHSVHLPTLKEPRHHADIGGWYDSMLRRTDRGWRFTRVRLTFVWEDGVEFVHGTS